jgi:tetratricopeptide (TPR) repeat protein
VARNQDPSAPGNPAHANPASANPAHTLDPSSTARIEEAAAEVPAAATGSRDPERYQVLGEYGRGGLGRVSRAHDRALGRDVAIKELISGGPVSEVRFLREALITARLEHPGIVPVHEAGRWPDGTPFYAMKLVSGRPLRDLIAERPTVDQRIGLLHHVIAVADAIAYAHGRNIIHRDLKPSNVIVGDFGETIVIDWGLAKDLSVAEETAVGGGPFRTPHDTDLTASGAILGTPLYMAPEQHRGEHVDQRADVYAIGGMLWELCALEKAPEMARQRYRLLRQAGIDKDLATIIVKALDPEPERRYADAGALAADLKAFKSGGLIAARSYSVFARLSRWLRRRRALVVSTAAVVGATIAIMLSGRSVPELCAAPSVRLGAVWSPARRASLGTKLASVDPVQGASRYARIASALDAGAQDWRAMHVEACRATRVEGRQSDTLLDRRMGCLDHWLGELGDTVHVIEQARDLEAVDRATRAATELSPLAACADVHALSEALPPPIELARRTRAAELTRRAQELDIEARAGRLDGLPEKVRELVAEARRVDHAPTLVAALAVRTRVSHAVGDHTDRQAAARELAQVAARARDDRSAAFAWSDLITTLATRSGKLDEATALVPTANAAVLRAGDPPELRANLLYSQAQALNSGPQPQLSLDLLTQARQLLEQAGATSPSSPFAGRLADIVAETGMAYSRRNEPDAAIASYHDAIERRRALYGSDSPDEAIAWQAIGAVHQRNDKQDEALAAFRAAARIREARLGDSPLTASSLVAVASVLNEKRRWDEALALYDRALRMNRAKLPPGDLQLTAVLVWRAITLNRLERLDEAAQSYDEALAIYERAGAKSYDMATTFYNRGQLETKRGRYESALRDYARALALIEQLRGANADHLIWVLVGQARCLILSGRSGDAIAPLERALKLPAVPENAVDVIHAQYYLGRARVETRRDVAGGIALVRAARAGLASDVWSTELVREIDAWLAAKK